MWSLITIAKMSLRFSLVHVLDELTLAGWYGLALKRVKSYFNFRYELFNPLCIGRFIHVQ